jgi:type I restriction enzyme, S subunit
VKNNNIPEIRFPGYTEDWEQSKLGEVFEQTSEYVNPKVENLELWSLTVEKGLTPKTERYNREFLVKKEDQFKSVSDNEFIYNPMNMTLGAVDLNLTGKKVAVSGYYITMKTTDNYDSKYFGIWLKTPLAIKMYKVFATGSLIERQRVQFQTLSQIKALVPSKEEQAKIGDFFKKLDDTITLQQQELTTLKQTKQGFLQKMFPKEGESVPKIRFPRFTGNWKKRKLGNHAEILTGGTPKTQIKEYWEPKEIPWMSSGEINKKRLSSTDNMISKLGFEKSSARWVRKKSVLIALAGQGKTRGTVAINEIPLTTNQSIAAIVPKGELYYEFIFQNLEKRYEELRLISSGDGTRGGLNKQLVSDVEIMSPSIEEQIKIGNLFKQLDAIINLHQHELEALQKTKKAFLQKMFV